jgi:hypothetical protein
VDVLKEEVLKCLGWGAVSTSKLMMVLTVRGYRTDRLTLLRALAGLDEEKRVRVLLRDDVASWELVEEEG